MMNNLEEFFDPKYIYAIEKNKPIEIKEEKKGGEGVCTFKSAEDALVIKTIDNTPPIWALSNKKCAEGAFITKTTGNDSYDLHILEMKSKLTSTEFKKVIDQFKGMYLTAISMMAVKQIPYPKNIYLYIAYTNNAIDAPEKTNLITNKVLTGGAPNIARQVWNKKSVDLHHGISGTLIKKQRINGDADFGYV